MEAHRPAESLVEGPLEVRPGEGMALAGGRVVTLSVREFDLLTALMGRAGHVVRREDLYGLVWHAPLRSGDRSIDVYVHKLRVKLESAIPGYRFIHTHIGFGYRLAAEPSHPFHNSSTGR